MLNYNYCSELAELECSKDRFCKNHMNCHFEGYNGAHTHRSKDIDSNFSSDQKSELEREISYRISLLEGCKSKISRHVKEFITKIKSMLAEKIKRINEDIKSYMSLSSTESNEPEHMRQIERILQSRLICKNFDPIDDSPIRSYFERDFVIEFDQTKQLECFLENYSTDATCIKLTYDNNYAGVGYLDHSIKLWDLNTMQLHKLLLGHRMRVICIEFSRKNEFIVSGSLDATIILWNMENGQKIQIIDQNFDVINQVAIMPDQSFIVSTLINGTFIAYDMQDKTKTPFVPDFKVSSFALLDSIIIIGLFDLRLALFDMIHKKVTVETEVKTRISCIAAFPERKSIITGDLEGKILVWDLLLKKKAYLIVDLKFKVIALSAKFNLIACWNSKSITILHSKRYYLKAYIETNGLALGDLYKENQIILIKEEIEVWSLDDNKKIRGGSTRYYEPKSFLVSSDLKMISIVLGQEVHVWDLKYGKTLFDVHDEHVYCAVFSPNGEFLVTGGENIKVYNFHQKNALYDFKTNEGVQCLAVSDNVDIAAGCHDYTIQLWAISGLKNKLYLGYTVSSVAFTHDCKFLAYIVLNEFHLYNLEIKCPVFKNVDDYYIECVVLISEDDKYLALQDSKSQEFCVFEKDSKELSIFPTKIILNDSKKNFTLGMNQLLFKNNNQEFS